MNPWDVGAGCFEVSLAEVIRQVAAERCYPPAVKLYEPLNVLKPVGEDLDQLIFRGSRFMEEVVFFHRKTRTLILADLLENFEPEKVGSAYEWLVRLVGAADPDGKAPIDLRLTFLGRKSQARVSFERMLAWEPEKVIVAHGRWYERDGTKELRRAFRWL